MVSPAQPIERKLAAIFAADVAGYSRLMGQDEVGTMRTLTAHREVMDRLIAQHRGRIANTAGDSVLAEFPSVVDAVECAVEVQEELREKNEGVPEERQLRFRIGVHVGDVMVRGGDLLGDGVNVAARLQALAEPGGVCVSGDVHQYARRSLALAFTDLGQQAIRHIAEGVRAYAVQSTGGCAALPQEASPKPLALPDIPSIAVLPFANLSGDPKEEYFADGVVEDIITALSRVKSFFVIDRNSSFTYKGRVVDVKQVGRELGVRYVLEGGIRKAGKRLRITGQLVEAATGHQLWADRFEGDVEETFELQDKITESVIGALEPSITAAEIARATAKPTDSLDAYELYLRALPHYYSWTIDGYREAQKLLSRAIEIDPSYARAKALSAYAVTMLANAGWASKADPEAGIRLAREALAANRDDPATLRMSAHSLAYLAHEYDLALVALDRAIALNPNSAPVLGASGWVRSYIADTDTARDHFKRAIRLSPLDPEMSYLLGGLAICCLMVGEDAEGLAYARRAASQTTMHHTAPRALVAALVSTGHLDEARKVVQSMLRVTPTLTVGYLRKMWPYRDHRFRDKYLGALRNAGLPE
jgi:adenylate cyclase